jgi:hypothetical protein
MMHITLGWSRRHAPTPVGSDPGGWGPQAPVGLVGHRRSGSRGSLDRPGSSVGLRPLLRPVADLPTRTGCEARLCHDLSARAHGATLDEPEGGGGLDSLELISRRFGNAGAHPRGRRHPWHGGRQGFESPQLRRKTARERPVPSRLDPASRSFVRRACRTVADLDKIECGPRHMAAPFTASRRARS